MTSDSRIEPPPANASLPAGGLAVLDLELLAGWFTKFPDPVLLTDSQARLVFLNPAAEDLLGCSVQSEEHCPLCTEIVQTGSVVRYCVVEECLRGKRALNRVPVRLRNRHGDWSSLTVSATPLQDKGGNPAGCLAVLRDIEADLKDHPEIKT